MYWSGSGDKKGGRDFVKNCNGPLNSSKSEEFFDSLRRYVLAFEAGFSSMDLVFLFPLLSL
jgi:hypothetical protein